MALESCASAIQWYLKNQGKADVAEVVTKQIDDANFEIVVWEVDGLDCPTEDQIKQISADYNNSVVASFKEKKDRFQVFIGKFKALGFSEAEITEFITKGV